MVLPLRGRPGTDLSTLKALLRAVRERGLMEGRLHGFAAPPTAFAVARAHLGVALVAMLLGLLWPLGGGLILLGLAASLLSRALGGPGLRLARGRPCWSLLLRALECTQPHESWPLPWPKAPGSEIKKLVVAPDGQAALVLGDTNGKVVPPVLWRNGATQTLPVPGGVLDADWSPDGAWFLTAGMD
ncbi:MAG TPA: hypothetical protein PKW90_18095, partial [Myxococcota bacterium]|nr:hypothetical protein [Myxococcota bacterium]